MKHTKKGVLRGRPPTRKLYVSYYLISKYGTLISGGTNLDIFTHWAARGRKQPTQECLCTEHGQRHLIWRGRPRTPTIIRILMPQAFREIKDVIAQGKSLQDVPTTEGVWLPLPFLRA